MHKTIRWALIFAIMSLAALVAAQTTYYVNDSAGNDGNAGTSPGLPFKTIQQGIVAAVAGDTVEVADGTYTGLGNVGLNFSGKDITVRSSSGNPALCIIDGGGTSVGVQFLSGEFNAVLEGFTLRNCRAENAFSPATSGNGGAVRIENAVATIRNCIFRNNVAEGSSPGSFGRGGAIHATFGGAFVDDCVFENNSARGFSDAIFANCGEGYGGAAFAEFGGFTFTRCTFVNNESIGGTDGISTAASIGGAVYVDSGTAEARNCGFTGNKSQSAGGLFASNFTIADFDNCAFVNNEATGGNGGAAIMLGSIGEVTNCTFARNLASGQGGGIYADGSNDLVIVNSIFWLNGGAGGGDSVANSGTGSASYTIFQDGVPAGLADGGNNLTQDPLFKTNPGPGNPGNVELKGTSPAIDSGDNNAVVFTEDLNGDPRIHEGTVDLGAYEFSADPLQMTLDLQASVQALITNGQLGALSGGVLRYPLDRAIVNLQAIPPRTARAILNLREFQALTFIYQLFGFITPAQGTQFRSDAEAIIALLSS